MLYSHILSIPYWYKLKYFVLKCLPHVLKYFCSLNYRTHYWIHHKNVYRETTLIRALLCFMMQWTGCRASECWWIIMIVNGLISRCKLLVLLNRFSIEGFKSKVCYNITILPSLRHLSPLNSQCHWHPPSMCC